LGFSGPFPGGKHQKMRYDNYSQIIPNNKEFSAKQLKDLLKQVQSGMGREQLITPDEWEDL